jgi:hypothetical protein
MALVAGTLIFASCAKTGTGSGAVSATKVKVELTVDGMAQATLDSRGQELEYRTKITIPSGVIQWQAPMIEQELPDFLVVRPDDVLVTNATMTPVLSVDAAVGDGVVSATFRKDQQGSLDYMSGQTYIMIVRAKIKPDYPFNEMEALGGQSVESVSRFVSEGNRSAEAKVTLTVDSQMDVAASEVFTDASCSVLKPGVTAKTVGRIREKFYRDIATGLYNGTYNTEFRTQSFRAWQHPSVMAAANKTARYQLLDNATGIYVKTGETLTVLVGAIPNNVEVYLRTVDMPSTGGKVEKNYPLLATGRNDIAVEANGLVYVMYHTNTGTEAAVNMNFVTCSVNGYFDKARHAKGDWTRLRNAAVGPYFDLIGEYAHLLMPVTEFKSRTPDGLKLIENYDKLVYDEMEFMGLVKYDKMFPNRMFFRYDSASGGWMWAGDYETGYVKGTMNTICGFMISNTDIWGPAHEVGHVNQTRPGLRWHGVTETTNNLFSLNAQVKFGLQTRLTSSGDYDKWAINPGDNTVIGGQKALAQSGDHFEKLVPFWQLKLYLVDALGQEDFYKDLFEHYRVTPTINKGNLTDGVYQLDFVRQVCRLANLDLTDFFTTWGFLRPVDALISDYSDAQFTITQQQIDDLKAEIAVYPKPRHSNIHHITDATVNNYK